MRQNQNREARTWIILGILMLAAGIMSVAAGFSAAQTDTRLYLLLEVIGAAGILAGMTPLIRYFQNRQAEDQTSSYSANAEQESQNRSGFHPTSGWVMADITGITRNLRTSGRDQVEYYVLCRYYDGVTHSFQTFTSRPLKEYPGKEIIGKRVKVVFHSSDPDDYTVDLNSIS